LALISLILGLVLGWQGSRAVKEEDKVAQVTKRLEKEATGFQRQLDELTSVLNTQSTFTPFIEIVNNFDYPIFLYEQGRLTYWSDNHFIPQFQDISSSNYLNFVEFRQGQYVVVRIELAGVNRQLVGLVPIFQNSQIDNEHLKSSVNTKIFTNSAVIISKYPNDRATTAIDLQGQTLFYVGFTENYIVNNEALLAVSFWLLVISLLSGIVLAIQLLVSQPLKVRRVIGFSLFLASARALMIFTAFPQRLISSKIFDPSLFASSIFNPSLGDMLINIVFLLIFVIALIGLSQTVTSSIDRLSKSQKMLSVFGLTVGAQFILFLQFLVVQTLYRNSRYSLDITQSINFSYDRVVVFVIFALSALLFFLFSHLCYTLIVRIYQGNIKTMWMPYVMGTLLFLGTLLHIGHPVISVVLSIIYFLLILRFGLLKRFEQIDYFSFIYLFCGILISTAVCTYAIDYFEKARITQNKEKFAAHFLIENDVLAEYLLAEAIENISTDAFIKSRMFSPFISNKDAVKEKISKVYLNRYFDRYDIQINLYNSKGNAFDEDNQVNYHGLKKRFGEENTTSYKDLFYVNKLEANVTKRYGVFIEIMNYGLTTGYVAMDLKLKKIIPDNVYPELLVDGRFLLPFENKNYSYAIYNDGDLLSHSGDFNYLNDFDSTYLNGTIVKTAGFDHLILADHEGREIVISSKEYEWFNVASNFSFLLLILMFLVVLILLWYAIYFYISGKSLNYSARIQLYFNLAFFLPLFAVSVTTVSLVTASYKEEVEHEHFKKALLISHNLEESLKGFSVDTDRGELGNNLASIAGFSSADANLFDIQGKLIATSQPLIYKKGVLSPYLATHAMQKIINERLNNLTIGEQVGTLKYNTTYVAIKENSTGDLVGVLSVPYFESEFKLEKEKIEVFTTILNIFTLVFIVFLVISYFASKWLTFPLLFITQKLKQTTLSGTNEPLLWKSSDEIGLMVSEYNKMVRNLEDSKKALARTQKESAWREMAQQVAHEIKNPITPMKLTLQQLKRTLGDNDEMLQFQKPVNILLSQVDTLSEIATSFSSFAKMPMPEQEKYELTKVITNTVALYENNASDNVTLEVEKTEVFTIGDEKLMGRILSNVIINAKQSAGDIPMEVLVKMSNINDKKILITVSDNGTGIPEDIREKVFIPNFTTKSSGSGIGLAIAKHGIEQSGGKIWFETEDGKGTTFFIELVKVV
jgi:signal transduction histidine kinase